MSGVIIARERTRRTAISHWCRRPSRVQTAIFCRSTCPYWMSCRHDCTSSCPPLGYRCVVTLRNLLKGLCGRVSLVNKLSALKGSCVLQCCGEITLLLCLELWHKYDDELARDHVQVEANTGGVEGDPPCSVLTGPRRPLGGQRL